MPKYFWDNTAAIEEKLQQHAVLLLMLDFDGTLSPIALHPDKAFLPDKTKEILNILKKNPKIFLAIISGRQLKNVKEKVGIEGLIYSGNHGLEKEVFGEKNIFSLSHEVKQKQNELKQRLEKLTKKYPGSWIEDKESILVLQYRQVDEKLVNDLTKDFEKIAKDYAPFFAIGENKKVFEIRPITTINKGTFVKELIEKIQEKTKQHPLSIYVGDDVSDEDVFKVLPRDMSIVVGENQQSAASYFLKNQDEVAQFLTWLAQTI